MFVQISTAEAEKHAGKFACIKTIEDGKIAIKGKIQHREGEGVIIDFAGQGQGVNDPTFIHLHPKVIGDNKILLWAAPGEPDYSLLEPVKQDDPSDNGGSKVESNADSESVDSDNSGPQSGEDLSGQSNAEEALEDAHIDEDADLKEEGK